MVVKSSCCGQQQEQRSWKFFTCARGGWSDGAGRSDAGDERRLDGGVVSDDAPFFVFPAVPDVTLSELSPTERRPRREGEHGRSGGRAGTPPDPALWPSSLSLLLGSGWRGPDTSGLGIRTSTASSRVCIRSGRRWAERWPCERLGGESLRPSLALSSSNGGRERKLLNLDNNQRSPFKEEVPLPEVCHPCGRPSTTRAPRATAGTMRTSSVGPRRHRRRPAGEAPPALALLGLVLLLAAVRSVHAQCAERPGCLDDGIPNK